MTRSENVRKQWYEPYLAACNERRFDDLRQYVHNDVDGAADGSVAGVEQYIEGVRASRRPSPITGGK